jgi:hypothetical protein
MLLDPATGAVRRLARRGHHLDLARLGKLFSSQVSAVGGGGRGSCRLTTWPSGERLGILDGTVSR